MSSTLSLTSSVLHLLRPKNLAAALFCLTAIPVIMATQQKWEPVGKDDLTATMCKEYPLAPAEIIFEKRVLRIFERKHYVETYKRIKIYNPKAAEELDMIAVEGQTNDDIRETRARLTKPDGTTFDFDEKSFKEAVIAKRGWSKIKRKSLAIPNLAAGDVLDLHMSVTVDIWIGSRLLYVASQPIPVRYSSFTVDESAYDYSIYYFNLPSGNLKTLGSRQALFEARNLAPYENEPDMPSLYAHLGWYGPFFKHPYQRWFENDSDGVWDRISDSCAEDFHLLTKPSNSLKKAADLDQLLQGATTDEEKLTRIYEFCRTKIQNYDIIQSAEMQKRKKAILDAEKEMPSDTLSHRSGSSDHINHLFAALARAAGFEVRLFFSSNRHFMLDLHSKIGWLFLDHESVAVKLGNGWRLYAPGSYFTPPNIAPALIEFENGFICESDHGEFFQVPPAPASASNVLRKGRFTLSDDGTLEGTVEIEMTGHSAESAQWDWIDDDLAKIQSDYRDEIARRLPSAEISDLEFPDVRTTNLPVRIRYKVRVPGYAETAGSRLLLVLDYFCCKATPRYTADHRVFPIMFDFAKTVHDDVEITLPEHWAIDAAAAPKNIQDHPMVAATNYAIGYKGKSRRLVYKREFVLARDGIIAYQASAYPTLKDLFERINQSDNHAIFIKEVAAESAATGATAVEPQATPGTTP